MRSWTRPLLGSLLFCLWCVSCVTAATIQVGPGRALTVPSQAALQAHDGDTIEIDAGTYVADAAKWTASNLTIRGMGGRAKIISNGANIQSWGLWVIQGNNTTVEDVELSGCHTDGAGSGIRLQGKGLTLRRVKISDNDHGLLTNDETGTRTSDVLIEDSEFARNGLGDGQTHNIYVSLIHAFTMRRSYSHDSIGGQLVKSRALTTTLEYNLLMDRPGGTSNYEVDISCGGTAILRGNVIQQDARTSNAVLVTFKPETLACLPTGLPDVLTLVNNTLIGNRDPSYFIFAKGNPALSMANNLLVGTGPALMVDNVAQALPASNLQTTAPAFVDAARQDYHLTAASPGINQGIPVAAEWLVVLQPEYPPPATIPRTVIGAAMDLGAYEFGIPFTPLPPPDPPPQPQPPRVLTAPPIPQEPGWYQLMNTNIQLVDPCPTHTCNYLGAGGQSGVLSNWVSGTFDTKRNRLVLGPGGGHQGYFGNELYAINLNTFTVERLTDPTPLPSNFFTADYCFDDIGTPQKPEPAARHTYDTLAYLPVQDALWFYDGAPCRAGGGMFANTWRYDFTQRHWTYGGIVGGAHPGEISGGGPSALSSGLDPNTGDIFMVDVFWLYRYNITTNTFTQLLRSYIGGYHFTGVVDPLHKVFLVMGYAAATHGPGAYAWSIDETDPNKYVFQLLTLTGGEACWGNGYPGLAWDPIGQQVVCWNGYDTVYTLNWTTKTWTALTYPGGPGAPNPNGTYKRWAYSPTSDVFISVNEFDRDAFVFRMPRQRVPTGTTTLTVTQP